MAWILACLCAALTWQKADGKAAKTLAAAVSHEKLQFLLKFRACEQAASCELSLGQVQQATSQTVANLLHAYSSTYAEVSQPTQGCWEVRCTVQVAADKMAEANHTLYSFVTDHRFFANRLRDGLIQARANYDAIMRSFNLTSIIPLSSSVADMATSTQEASPQNYSKTTSVPTVSQELINLSTSSAAASAPDSRGSNRTLPTLVHNFSTTEPEYGANLSGAVPDSSTTEPESETNQSGAVEPNATEHVPGSTGGSSSAGAPSKHLRASTTAPGAGGAAGAGHANVQEVQEARKGQATSPTSVILAFATGATLCAVIAFVTLWCRRRAPQRGAKEADKEVEWLDVSTRTLKALPTGKAFRPLFPNYWWNKGMLPGMGRASGQPPEFSEQVHVAPHVRDTLQRAMDETFKRISTRDRRRELMPKRLRLLHVRRIENSFLWRHYAHQHLSISMQRTHKCTPVSGVPCNGLKALEQDINEVYLWHGTSPSKADCIAQDGLQLKFAGTGAGSNMYDQGIYFAECSSKADEYAQDSPDSEEGVYCLLLCRVVLGEVLRMTAGGEATHGIVRSAMQSEAYNSVLGDRESAVGTYKEFVVYKEAQVYPEYLLLYQREIEEVAAGSSDAGSKTSMGTSTS